MVAAQVGEYSYQLQVRLRLKDHSISFNHSLVVTLESVRSSLLSHTSNVNDLLEGLDGVLKDWLDGLHDTESSLHIVDLWLHALNSLHLSGDLNKGLSIIESLEDSGSKGFLDVLNGSGLSNGGISVTSGLGLESGGEGR